MSDRIVYEMPDGSLRLGCPAPGIKLSLKQIAARDKPKDAKVHILKPSSVPLGAEDFLGAWRRHKNGTIAVDLDAAKSLRMDRLRPIRDARLAALDVAFLRALEEGRDTAAIAAEKQALRDLPAKEKWKGVKTLEDIRAYMPELLKGTAWASTPRSSISPASRAPTGRACWCGRSRTRPGWPNPST
jgi:hypothetical protein